MARWGDGGWKPNFVNMGDDDMCNFLFKYGEKKMEELAKALKIPPKCPVPVVSFICSFFLFNLIKYKFI